MCLDAQEVAQLFLTASESFEKVREILQLQNFATADFDGFKKGTSPVLP